MTPTEISEALRADNVEAALRELPDTLAGIQLPVALQMQINLMTIAAEGNPVTMFAGGLVQGIAIGRRWAQMLELERLGERPAVDPELQKARGAVGCMALGWALTAVALIAACVKIGLAK